MDGSAFALLKILLDVFGQFVLRVIGGVENVIKSADGIFVARADDFVPVGLYYYGIAFSTEAGDVQGFGIFFGSAGGKQHADNLFVVAYRNGFHYNAFSVGRINNQVRDVGLAGDGFFEVVLLGNIQQQVVA